MDVEGIFWTLVVIVFTAIRIFELAGKRKGSKDRQARGAPRYEESDVLRGRGDDRTTAAPSRHPRGLESEQSAQVLLPDDLWEILTGERRHTPTPPAPVDQHEADDRGVAVSAEGLGYDEADVDPDDRNAPVMWRSEELEPEFEPAWSRDRSAWLEEETRAANDEHTGVPVRSRDPRELPERVIRKAPVRPREHEVVSLEEIYLQDDGRRTRARERRSARSTAETAWRQSSAGAARRRALRRAIILQEVLGPPKGLEEPV